MGDSPRWRESQRGGLTFFHWPPLRVTLRDIVFFSPTDKGALRYHFFRFEDSLFLPQVSLLHTRKVEEAQPFRVEEAQPFLCCQKPPQPGLCCQNPPQPGHFCTLAFRRGA